jgi:hypothetical protein
MVKEHAHDFVIFIQRGFDKLIGSARRLSGTRPGIDLNGVFHRGDTLSKKRFIE